MPDDNVEPTVETKALLARYRAFCFPKGEDSVRGIRAIKTTEEGQMRMSPEAHWVPFAAEQVTESSRSSFRWGARLNPGKLTSPTVVDAYEDGHGWLTVKMGGVIPVRKITGPEADRGELQRYLASIVFCPPMLLNHPSLRWTAIGPATLRIADAQDPTGATVDLDISEEGCPTGCRAERPRIVGKKVSTTPWSVNCGDFRVYEGLRIPRRLEVAWHLPEGEFAYYKSEIMTFIAVR